MKEYILCAAIWYKELPLVKEFKDNCRPKNCDIGVVFCGHRHPHCMYSMISMTGKRSVTSEVGEYEQGFLTSQNRFVDRVEGLQIAIDAKQLLRPELPHSQLYSEDLY